jgi:hypothetical protein
MSWSHDFLDYDDCLFHEANESGERVVVFVRNDRDERDDPACTVEIQIARLIAWLDHIAPDGIIPPPPKAEDA